MKPTCKCISNAKIGDVFVGGGGYRYLVVGNDNAQGYHYFVVETYLDGIRVNSGGIGANNCAGINRIIKKETPE